MTETVTIRFRRLQHGHDLPLPAYQSDHAAGMDLAAAVPEAEPVRLPPGGRALIPTGFAMALAEGFEAQLRPRSGLALKHGVTLLNTPGTVDADYRGEVKVLLINLGEAPFEVRRGMRIAQLVVQRIARARAVETQALEESGRGPGGFGSTGG